MSIQKPGEARRIGSAVVWTMGLVIFSLIVVPFVGCSSKTPTAPTTQTTPPSTTTPPASNPSPTPSSTGVTGADGTAIVTVPDAGDVVVTVTNASGTGIPNATVVANAAGVAAIASGYLPAIVMNGTAVTDRTQPHPLGGVRAKPLSARPAASGTVSIVLQATSIVGSCSGSNILESLGNDAALANSSLSCRTQPDTGFGVLVNTVLIDASHAGLSALEGLVDLLPAGTCAVGVTDSALDFEKLLDDWIARYYPDEANGAPVLWINTPVGSFSTGLPCPKPKPMAATDAFSNGAWSGTLNWTVSSPVAGTQRVRVWTGSACEGSPVIDTTFNTDDPKRYLESDAWFVGPPPSPIPHSLSLPLPGQAPLAAGMYSWEATSVVTPTDSFDSSCQILDLTTGAVSPTAPTATTTAATQISVSSATLNGSVTPNGASTTAHFEWGISTSYGNTTSPITVGSGTSAQSVTQPLTGLVANTTYHYRVVATNSAGTVNGADASFTTAATAPAPTPPPVVTNAASGVSATAATLNGSATPNGAATTAFFQWGTSAAYGNTTASQALGSGLAAVPVTANLTGLAANTTYHYRLVASNSAGTTNGTDVSFMTAGPAGFSIDVTPASQTIVQGNSAPYTVTVHSQNGFTGNVLLTVSTTGDSVSLSTETFAPSSVLPPADGSGTAILTVGTAPSTSLGYLSVTVHGQSGSESHTAIASVVVTTSPAPSPSPCSGTPPTATTGGVSNVTGDGATLSGSITPNGSATTGYFELGPTTSYGMKTANLDMGSGTGALSLGTPVTGLVSGTAYHFRAVAVSCAGTSYGDDVTFSTP